MSYAVIKTPVGNIELIEENGFLTDLNFTDSELVDTDNEFLKGVISQLHKYFDGKRKSFDVPLRINTTEFRARVYDELLKIPYGKTISYQELAERCKNPKAVRAVGGANHNNPISIIIPCHRVIGKNGSLTGYGGGIKVKSFLIELEKSR